LDIEIGFERSVQHQGNGASEMWGVNRAFHSKLPTQLPVNFQPNEDESEVSMIGDDCSRKEKQHEEEDMEDRWSIMNGLSKYVCAHRAE